MTKEEELLNTIEEASKRGAEYNIEILGQELIPTLLMITNTDDIKMAAIVGEKEEMPDMMAKILFQEQVKAYAIILEAWCTPFLEKAMEYNGKVRDMPLDDKFEIVNVLMVKRNVGIYKYCTARIETKHDGSRKVGDWEDGTVQGNSIVITDW